VSTTAWSDRPDLAGRELADKYGLYKVGGRPPLREYLRQVWDRRHFTIAFSRARAYSGNQGSYLGQLWAFLTPLLWAGLYYLIFGGLLGQKRDIPNFAAFLVCGLFVFRFIAGCMNNAAGSISKNQGLISSLQFPRILIPMSYAGSAFVNLIPAMIVLFSVAILTGEPVRLQNLMIVPTVAMAFVFAMGLSFISARLVDEVADLNNIIPFTNRAIMYSSGIFFELSNYGHGRAFQIMSHQPFAVYIELARSAILKETTIPSDLWLWGLGWAVVTFVLGFIYFWRAEAKYGRG
jgi:teichoic acid transport system permease protein